MLQSRIRRVVLLLTLLLGTVTTRVAHASAFGSSVDNPAQSPDSPAQSPLVPVRMIARVGDKPLNTRGDGECKHAPVAAAYGVRSQMWTARFSGSPDGEIHNLYLTLWRPLAGGSPDQFSLAMRTGGTDYFIDTVRGGPQRGSGTIRITVAAGGAGNFELVGRAADGTEIRLRVHCPSFTTLQPVGG